MSLVLIFPSYKDNSPALTYNISMRVLLLEPITTAEDDVDHLYNKGRADP